MMTIDLKAIRAAAEAAPYEAPWRYEPIRQTVWAGNTYMVADIRGRGHLQYLPNGKALQDATGVFIATANPATVIALLDRLEAAEKALAEPAVEPSTDDSSVLSACQKLAQAFKTSPPPPAEPAVEPVKGLFVDLIAQHPGLAEELVRLFTPLSDEQIQEAATLAVKRKELNWAGFSIDNEGFYTIPVLSVSHMKLIRIVEQQHGIGGES